MKKIFRMALVFALAGATLMYTGCTKDYDEDINAANQKIESIVAQHAADVAALKNDLSTAVSNLEAAYKKADDAVTAAYKAADADLQKAIDANKTAIDANKAAIDANKAAIADANTAIAAIEEELKTFATKEELAAAEAGLEAKIKAVADDLADVKAKLDKVAEDLGKQISDLDAKFTTALAEQKADLEGQIASALEAAKADLGTAKAELEAALALLGNELRSIVFEPELYYAGIEATNYTWTWINPREMYKNDADWYYRGEYDEETGNYGTVIFKKGSELWANQADYKKFPSYSLSQIATAYFNLNPSSFNVDSAKWALSGKDYEYLVRADAPEEEVWTPEFVKWDNGAVRYTIANPNLLPANIFGKGSFSERYAEAAKASVVEFLAENKIDAPANAFIGLGDLINWILGGDSQSEINDRFQKNLDKILKEIESLKGELSLTDEDVKSLQEDVKALYANMETKTKQIAELYYDVYRLYNPLNNVPAMRLTATLSGDRKVVSDYAAIVSDPEYFQGLAFGSKTPYTGYYKCSVGEHLYSSASSAVQNAASVPVAYDKTLDLNFVNIHMWDAYKGEYEATLADLQKVYSDLSMTYEIVNYIDGQFGTEEGKFGEIVDGVFYPKSVDKNGNQVDATAAVNGGTSAVGRKPLILVKLFHGDNLVLAGYFKIVIVKEISTVTLDIDPFDTLPFICKGQTLTTKWSEFSAALESLGTTYKQFNRDYKIVEWFTVAGQVTDQDDNNRAVVYELDKDGNFVDTYTDETGDKFASIRYYVDGFGEGVNNVFMITVSKAQADRIGAGKSKTVYVRFVKDLYEEVYVSFTISIAEPAKFDFGANKLANEWFKMVEPEVLNTVLMNVPVPAEAGDYIGFDRNAYSRDLDHFFVGYEPSKVLTADSPEVYKSEDLYDEEGNPILAFAPHYEYLFNAEQTCEAFDFVVNEDGDKLYLEEIDEAGDNLIASINGTTLSYATTDAAKEVLNAFPHNATARGEMVWADIHVNVTYGNCDIDAGSADFHVRFLRPLNVKFAAQDIKEESQVNGANLYIKNFLDSIVDWNNQKVVDYDAKGVLQENYIKEKVNMYYYYGFQFMIIDLENATRNNVYVGDPEFYNMKKVTPKAKLTFGFADKDNYFTPSVSFSYGKTKIPISSLSMLDGRVINYKNDSANVEEFTIKIPVQVIYYWGTIEEEIVVNVKKTTDTEDYNK